MRNDHSTLRVTPVTDGNRSFIDFIEWWITFDCDEAREADLVRTLQGVYQPGFQALKQHFAG